MQIYWTKNFTCVSIEGDDLKVDKKLWPIILDTLFTISFSKINSILRLPNVKIFFARLLSTTFKKHFSWNFGIKIKVFLLTHLKCYSNSTIIIIHIQNFDHNKIHVDIERFIRFDKITVIFWNTDMINTIFRAITFVYL